MSSDCVGLFSCSVWVPSVAEYRADRRRNTMRGVLIKDKERRHPLGGLPIIGCGWEGASTMLGEFHRRRRTRAQQSDLITAGVSRLMDRQWISRTFTAPPPPFAGLRPRGALCSLENRMCLL